VGVSFWLFTSTFFEWMDRVRLFNKNYFNIFKRIKSQPRSANGMTIAHLGMSFIILGVVGSSAWKEEVISFVEKGSQLKVAGFLVTFEGVSIHQGPNYNSEKATLKVEKEGKFLENLYPERRLYLATGTSTTESAIRQSLAGDLYVTISEPANNKFKGKWVLRLIYEPLVNFIWLGASFLALGGIISITDRRYKIGRTFKYRRTKPINKVVGLDNF
jgi:cytochrome c-type biogenesis protein CcmF